MTQRIERSFAGRSFVLETGRMAKQAAGSALIQFGDTMVLAAITVSDKESKLPFFPLTVEYKEKAYAAGKIPGGFIKREGRPRDEEILACRIIDRSIRPLFPEGFKNEVQVFIFVLSADQENDADVLGLTAASFALCASPVPFAGPIAGVRVGRVQEKWVLNPTFEQLEYSDMDIVVAGSQDSIMMVEGGALEISEEDMVEALSVAQKGIRELIAMQEEVLKKTPVEKMTWKAVEKLAGLPERVRTAAEFRMREALNQKDKQSRVQAIEAVKAEVATAFAAEFPDHSEDIRFVLGEIEYEQLRTQVLETKRRVDGRKTNEVRPITIDAGLLPRAHGSALFTRGQTQALVAVTLGTQDDVQRLDGIDDKGEASKAFMLHYNFPPFSTGEVRPIRGTSRREIGHGNLAERAIQGVLPPFEDFPYTIRIVSDVLESNGSSSMASVCGGSLACFDAGIPIKSAVAGVAMGLIKEGDTYAILTDILGTEDALGDMDFKVAGTEQGITSIQMDIKIQGLSLELITEALAQANEGRMHILGEMKKAVPEPRADLSQYAPRIVTVQISPEKIGDLIGPKGKTIRGIQDETGATLSVEDDGVVTIAAVGGEAMERAKQMVAAITAEPVVGEIYEGTVKSTTAFGAFVEIMPGTEALVHISELTHGRVEKTEDVIKRGDRVKVKLIDRDERGRLRLSMKALIPKPEGQSAESQGEGPQGGDGGEAGAKAAAENGDRKAVIVAATGAVAAGTVAAEVVAVGATAGDAHAGDAHDGDAHVTLSVPETVAVERTEFPNGLVVCSEFIPGVRSIAFGAWVRAASVHERREQMGASHLLEHLVFKGTRKRTAHDIALALESRGGSIDAYTGREHTAFQAHFLDRDLPIAVDLIRDLIFAPLLKDDDLQLERQVVFDEIALVHDTPDDQVFEEHNAALWGRHPYGYSILGTRETVGALTQDALRALHRDTYRPDNVVVAAAGNIRHEQLVAAMKEAGWSDVPASRKPQPERSNPVPSPASRVHVPRDSQQAHLVFGSTTIPMADATRPAYLVVSALFGGGMSSRLFQKIREQMGLAYSVYGFHTFHSDVGIHGVYVGTGPDTAQRAQDAVSDELRRLVDDGIEEDELATGRQQLIGQFILSQESVGARMQRVAGRELYGEPYRTVDEVIKRIESVSPADALGVARQWFAPDRQTIVVLGPA